MAHAAGALVVSDEVMCGLARHGQGGGKCFLSDAWGLEPDCLTFGKAVATGIYPLAGRLLPLQVPDAVPNGPQRPLNPSPCHHHRHAHYLQRRCDPNSRRPRDASGRPLSLAVTHLRRFISSRAPGRYQREHLLAVGSVKCILA